MRTIKVFTKQFCPTCTMTKDFLDHHKIDFQQIDVTTDAAARSTLQALGYLSLPVVLVNDDGQIQSWTGFCPDLLKKLI